MTTLIELSLPVYNPTAIAKNFNQLAVYRSVDYGVTWAELTGPATRLPISASQVLYEYNDPNGDLTYQYAVAYFNSATGIQSSLGEPITAAGDQTESILSIQDLVDIYLPGIDLTTNDGTPFKQSMYILALKAAIGQMETALDLALVPTIVNGELQDYFKPNDCSQPLTFRTNRAPVQSVQRVQLRLPGTGNTPYTYDPSWIQLRGDLGRITIFPINGVNAYPIPFGGSWASYASYNLDVIPSALSLDYVAGFALGKVPGEIVDCVGQIAAVTLFNPAGNLLGGAGISSYSLSLDGLSQSVNNTSSAEFSGYGSTIRVYQQTLAERMPALRRRYRGTLLTAV